MDLEARRKRQRGWALVSVLFMTAGTIAFVRTRPTDPQALIDRLIAQVASSDGRKLTHRLDTAFVAFLPNHGYHLTVYVGKSSRFAPARYVVISRIGDDLSVDLMVDQGAENVVVLRGQERQAFLERTQLDLAALDGVFERRFTSEGLRGQRQAR